jgi:hypothetical protein
VSNMTPLVSELALDEVIAELDRLVETRFAFCLSPAEDARYHQLAERERLLLGLLRTNGR